MSTLSHGLGAVRARIAAACQRSGRPPDAVTLIGVSKRQPSGAIVEGHSLGLRDFGENYAQELRDKARELSALEGLRWHAIGPLQLNKVRYVAAVAHAFHALDRLDLAEALSHRRTGAPLEVFLEVNLGGEASKSGVAPEALEPLLEGVRALPGLRAVGLMALPPLARSPEDSRPHFRRLRELARSLGLPGLSMGTTADFEVAIEEGATHVRVGTAIFGDRPARHA